MSEIAGIAAAEAQTAPRRRRRTREDGEQRIHAAARQLFAERGFAATTTREIARLADVSETLLFRYYRDKAGVFDTVVTLPFRQLMDDFVQRHPDQRADDAHLDDTKRFTRQVYALFEANEGLFRALLAGPERDGGQPGLGGLNPFFDQAVAQVSRRYAASGQQPPFDLAIGVRLGLGMIAASILLRDALFADLAPDREAVMHALEHFVAHTLAGPTQV